MSDLNYNINANVTGGEEVDALAEDMATIEAANDTTVNVDATGISEAAEGLESISGTDAPTRLGEVGSAASTAAVPVGGLGASFKELVAAIGVAQIAGAGVEFVIGKVRDRLDFIAQTKAWDAAQVEAYEQAVQDVGAGLDAVVEKLRESGEFTEIFTTGLASLGGGGELDVAGTLGHFGVTIDEVARAIEGGEGALGPFRDRLEEAGLRGALLDQVMGAVADETESYGQVAAAAADHATFFSESQRSANEALQGLLDERDPMRSFQSEWALLMESMSDGSIDTTAAANALNTLSDGLGLTTDQVLELAQAGLDEIAAGAREFANAVNSIDFQNADLEGATTAFAEFTTGLFAAQNQVQTQEEAFARLRAAADGVALTFDVTTEAGRAQQDALEGVAAVLDQQLAQAYDAAGGSQEAFVSSAITLGNETLARLQEELNLTDEQVGALAETLGLTATDYRARFELAGTAEAQLQLSLLQGAIEGLPAETEAQVNLQILEGDFVGARDTIVQFYKDNPVTTEVEPTFNTQKILATPPEPFPVEAELDTADADADMDAFTGEERTADVTAEAHVAQADLDLNAVADAERTAIITANAHVAQADLDIDAVANAERTAIIDVATGSVDVPTASQIARRIGTVRVPIQAYWVHRIEGSRPGP